MTFWIHKLLATEYEGIALRLHALLKERMPKRDRKILLRVIDGLMKAKNEMVYGT